LLPSESIFLRFFDEIANQTSHNIAKSAYLPREEAVISLIGENDYENI